jgi:Ca2+-binding EF-hand superfamily protein
MRSLITWLAAVVLIGCSTLAFAQGMKPVNRQALIESCDKNGDGKIDRAEYFERITDVFFLADANKDGYLEMSEILAAVPDANPERIKSADTNGDGKIDLHELQNALSKDFERADLNGDGVLDKDEVQHMLNQK